MGTIVGLTLINRVSRELKDPNNRRWSIEQMLDWLNDGQREICLLRPEAYVITAILRLVAGTKQTLPAAGRLLIDAIRNEGPGGDTPGKAVTIAEREALDAVKPSWQASTGSSVIESVIYDRRAPTVFFVYPGVAADVGLMVQYAAVPPDVTVDSVNEATESSAISIDDIYATALTDYLHMRALAKDTDAQDSQRSSEAYQRFLNRLGLKLQVERMADPNANSPPREVKRENSRGNAAY
jgi:predicted amino acid-binding ACT domain protein